MIPGALNYQKISVPKPYKPLWTVEFEDEEEFLKWAEDFCSAIHDSHAARTAKDLRCRDFYMGIQSLAMGQTGFPRDMEGKPMEKFARVVAPQAYEIVEQWVSKMTRYPPAIAVLPNNEEYNDRIAAKMSKDFIDYLFYVNDIDETLEEAARLCRIEAEAYIFVEWDETKGDYQPDAQEMLNSDVRIPVVDSEGNEVIGEDGKPLRVTKAPRTGDVKYSVVPRRFLLREPNVKWSDANFVIKISSASVDELRAKYPDRAEDIDPKAGKQTALLSTFEVTGETDEAIVFELYHKSSEFLEKGRYIKFIDGVVLENKDLQYSHGELPAARLSNIDVPGVAEAFCVVEQIMLLNVVYNNLISLGYTNIALGAHLYWMIPNSANVDITKIRNGSSVLKFAGGMPPTLQQFKTVGPEIFQMIELVDKAIQRPAGIQSVSRGEPPAGIEAGVALAFLEEQENQRANTDIKKHNALIKKIARLSLSTAGDYYKPEHARTMRIVGKNNTFSVKALDVAKLGGPYDIRVQRTTALSESKSGRLSQILALEGRFPGKVPWEHVADMLDLANDKKYYNLAAVAVEASERENELMVEGADVLPPDEWEEHTTHWTSHFKFMQSASFKEDAPPEIKKAAVAHLGTHEMWMWRKANANPLYMQKIMALEGFPAVTDVPAPPQQAMPGGEAPMPPPGDPNAMPMGQPAMAPDELAQEAPPPEEGVPVPNVGPVPPPPPEESTQNVPTEQR